MSDNFYKLYPEIEPYQSGWLQSTSLHHIYYEQCGNPMGLPVVFMHGGPGSGCNPTQRRFFDPAHYRIVLFDQRGCGRSKPLGCVEENSTELLVQDIEALRTALGIERWLVFGGSWGSTLALVYAIAHPQCVLGLILRGIFLSRPAELNWFLHDVNHFYPEPYQKLIDFLHPSERNDVLNAYAKRVFSEDAAVNVLSAIRWNAYESSIMSLLPGSGSVAPVGDDVQLARARVQLHYILHGCFVGRRDLLAEASLLDHIPTIIVQGRYDMVCPPLSAWELKQAMPHAELHMIANAGHSAMEAGTTSALITATEKFKSLSGRQAVA